MCVAAFSIGTSAEWPLVLMANRDEYHQRPTAPLSAWNDGSTIIAGQDLLSGGTWLGVSPAGRLAFVTNVRHPDGPDPSRRSRGELITVALRTGLSGLEELDPAQYNRFNLVALEHGRALYAGNHPNSQTFAISPGLYGVSNAGFDEPWPKVGFLKSGLERWLSNPDQGVETLFALLADQQDSGRLSGALSGDVQLIEARDTPAFVCHPVYGTRCSTVVVVDGAGRGLIVERRFDAAGHATGETEIAFDWPEFRA